MFNFRLSEVIRYAKFMDVDGLNSVQYLLKSVTLHRLFTHVVVDLPGPRLKAELKAYAMIKYSRLEKRRSRIGKIFSANKTMSRVARYKLLRNKPLRRRKLASSSAIVYQDSQIPRRRPPNS